MVCQALSSPRDYRVRQADKNLCSFGGYILVVQEERYLANLETHNMSWDNKYYRSERTGKQESKCNDMGDDAILDGVGGGW